MTRQTWSWPSGWAAWLEGSHLGVGGLGKRGDVWRHVWLSQLRGSDWYIAGGGRGYCSRSHHGGANPATETAPDANVNTAQGGRPALGTDRGRERNSVAPGEGLASGSRCRESPLREGHLWGLTRGQPRGWSSPAHSRLSVEYVAHPRRREGLRSPPLLHSVPTTSLSGDTADQAGACRLFQEGPSSRAAPGPGRRGSPGEGTCPFQGSG